LVESGCRVPAALSRLSFAFSPIDFWESGFRAEEACEVVSFQGNRARTMIVSDSHYGMEDTSYDQV
jgi:hypothetical protein